MELNIDPNWLLRMTEKEDNRIVSVGGFFTRTDEEESEMPTPRQYQRSYCPQCQGWMVICKTCGNNSCNGGSGELENGDRCPDCDEAYRLMMDENLLMQLPEWSRRVEG